MPPGLPVDPAPCDPPLILPGIAPVGSGLLVACFPGSGAMSSIWAIGFPAIVFGGLPIGLGPRFRRAWSKMRAGGRPAVSRWPFRPRVATGPGADLGVRPDRSIR
ncbi:MAG: hypothetical protein AVDCRST_MAG73-2169 [uncultured Thermomicrobiales bacterium]|uniref:Uncharacterized protein n=1 Tax=uncultured Thermomicrobiales bacterium TaxID=1645740 RepID=A0A6J4U8C1_9BACT|nr:MAG: hypothetical protein AVDCRST_MAG73-2169 [uncultured Thermomicrobiales bacterium]